VHVEVARPCLSAILGATGVEASPNTAAVKWIARLSFFGAPSYSTRNLLTSNLLTHSLLLSSSTFSPSSYYHFVLPLVNQSTSSFWIYSTAFSKEQVWGVSIHQPLLLLLSCYNAPLSLQFHTVTFLSFSPIVSPSFVSSNDCNYELSIPSAGWPRLLYPSIIKLLSTKTINIGCFVHRLLCRFLDNISLSTSRTKAYSSHTFYPWDSIVGGRNLSWKTAQATNLKVLESQPTISI